MKRCIKDLQCDDTDIDVSTLPPQWLPDDCLLLIFRASPQRAWFLVSKRLRQLFLDAQETPGVVDWYAMLVAPWVEDRLASACWHTDVTGRPFSSSHLIPEHERTPLIAAQIRMATDFHYGCVDCLPPTLNVSAQCRQDFALLFETVFRCRFWSVQLTLVDWMRQNSNCDAVQSLAIRNYHRRDFLIMRHYDETARHGHEHYYTLAACNNTSDCVRWTHAVNCSIGGDPGNQQKTKPSLRTISDLIWLVLDGAPSLGHDTRSLKHCQQHTRFSKFIVPFCNERTIMAENIMPAYVKFATEFMGCRGLQPYRVQWVIYDEVLRLVGIVPMAYEYVTDRYNDMGGGGDNNTIATTGGTTKKRLVLVTCPCISLGQALMEKRHALELQLCKTILESRYHMEVVEMLMIVFTDATSAYQVIQLEDDAQLLEYALEIQGTGDIWTLNK